LVASTFSEDGTARTLTARYDSSPCVDRGPDVVGTLRTKRPGEGGVQGDFDHIVPVISPALNTQSGSHHAPDTKAYVATYPINSMNAFRSPDAAASTGLGVGHDGEAMYTLTKEHNHAVAFDTTQITSPQNYSNPQPGDPCHPLAAGAHPPAIAYSFKPGQSEAAGGIFVTEEYSPTLQAANNGSTAVPAVAIDNAHAFKVRGGCEGGGKGYLGSDDVAFTISTHQDQHIFSEAPAVAYLEKQKPLDPYLGGEVTIAIDASYSKGCGGTSAAERPVVASNSTVRRLTPVECERLQGFPDNFTAIPWGKKEAADCPDGPRYKALGNSMAVPVMRWIGERINIVDDLISLL
jgi:site-specific DNA-cytosine methylase